MVKVTPKFIITCLYLLIVRNMKLKQHQYNTSYLSDLQYLPTYLSAHFGGSLLGNQYSHALQVVIHIIQHFWAMQIFDNNKTAYAVTFMEL